MPPSTPTYKSYDEAVNAMSGGRGFAWLGAAEKEKLDTMQFQTQQSAPVASTTGLREPSVISTATAKDQFQQNVQPTIDSANKAITQTQQKVTTPTPPPPSLTDADILARDGETDTDKLNRQQNELYDKQKTDIQSTYDQMVVMNTDAAKAQIAGLTAQWNERRRLLEDANRSNLATWKQQFTRSGQAEYSPGMTADFVTAKEQEGLRKVKELDDQYNAAVDAINMAMKDKNFTIAAQKTRELQSIEQKALDQAKENAKEASTVNKAYREKMIQASRDLAVVDLMQQGVTDPQEMLDLLNLDQSGKQIGDFTIKELNETIKNLNPDAQNVFEVQKTAAQNGAPPDLLRKIAQAGSASNALAVAGDYVQGGSGIVGEYNFYKRDAQSRGITPVDFDTFQNMDANRKKSIAKAGATSVSGLPNNVITQIDKLSASFDSSPIVKQYNEVLNKKLGFDSIINSKVKGPGDLALVYEFMKALDPSSVVREAEYESARKSGNIFAGTMAKYNGYLKEGGGFLPEKVRSGFQDIVNRKLTVAETQYKNLKSEVSRKINMKTGADDGEDYLTSYEGASTASNLLDQQTQAKEQLITIGKTNPALRDTIKSYATKVNPVLGRPMNESEIIQYLQATGKIK